MFEGLEADDDVDGLRGDRYGRAASRDKVEVWSAVSSPRMLEGIRGNIHADDLRRDTGEQVGAVPFTTGDIEDSAVFDELAGEQVAMNMLEPDVSRHFGHIPLASPFESATLVVCARHQVPMARRVARCDTARW